MGRAVIHPKSIGLFDTLETFTESGTFEVPDKHGDGSNVEVEMDCFGAGGGGGAAGVLSNEKGGDGGDGGKAISFRTYAPGAALTITVGAGGAGGDLDSGNELINGQAGELSEVKESTGQLVARGDGGGGGEAGFVNQPAANGEPGGGTADHVFTGAGAPGGAGAPARSGADGQPGTAGKVEIRY